MKTTQQTFESTMTSDSDELIELDDLSLSQVAGGGGPSKSELPTEHVSLNYTQVEYSYSSM